MDRALSEVLQRPHFSKSTIAHLTACRRLVIRLERLQKLREEKRHCDVIFVGESGSEFHCHKCVLSSCTDVFDACYRFKAKTENHQEDHGIERIDLKKFGVKESIFAIILNVIYCTQLSKIALDEAIDVIFDANKLLMDDVVNHAVDVIVDNDYLERKTQQLVKLCLFPGLTKCEKLLGNVGKHLQRNVAEVTKVPEFFNISVEVLCRLGILKSKESFASTNSYIDFIVGWVSYDMSNRMADIKKIVEYLNCDVNQNTVNDNLNKLSSAMIDMREKNNDPVTGNTLLKFGLQVLLGESVKMYRGYSN